MSDPTHKEIPQTAVPVVIKPNRGNSGDNPAYLRFKTQAAAVGPPTSRSTMPATSQRGPCDNCKIRCCRTIPTCISPAIIEPLRWVKYGRLRSSLIDVLSCRFVAKSASVLCSKKCSGAFCGNRLSPRDRERFPDQNSFLEVQNLDCIRSIGPRSNSASAGKAPRPIPAASGRISSAGESYATPYCGNSCGFNCASSCNRTGRNEGSPYNHEV